MGVAGPYAWEPHVAAATTTVAGVVAVVLIHRHLRRSSSQSSPWGRRRVVCFAASAVGLLVALTWPVADLAAHWSLTMLVLQRLLLLVLVAPLLWLGLPDDVLRVLTHPRPVDWLLARLQRPPVAVAVVTIVSVGSMTSALVRAQATSAVARAVIDVVVLLAGIVLWLPVLGRLPGIARPKPVVRFAYLVFQAVVPAFLSFIYIFSRRPLYSTFSHSGVALGIRPLTDQQVAGFVSKLTLLIVLLSVGSVVLARASRAEDELLDEPLVWADVERAFERADRERAHHPRPDDVLGPASAGDSAVDPESRTNGSRGARHGGEPGSTEGVRDD